MRLPQELKEILVKEGGIITTAKANAARISNERLRLLANAGELERVSQGVYTLPGELVDRMNVLQLKRPKIIYSHGTALYLHKLTDRDPLSCTVTVPKGYGTQKLKVEGLEVFMVKSELHELGKTQIESMFGHIITCYNLERTVCDCIRSRNQMDIAMVTDALKHYSKRSDKNLNVLMELAQVFRVEKLLRQYMGVLL